MAIRRCPYCKAIIDEEDKYCENCGTQLLFPEDESIEEEIPGDKIIDEEEEEVEEQEGEIEELEGKPEDEESGREKGEEGEEEPEEAEEEETVEGEGKETTEEFEEEEVKKGTTEELEEGEEPEETEYELGAEKEPEVEGPADEPVAGEAAEEETEEVELKEEEGEEEEAPQVAPGESVAEAETGEERAKERPREDFLKKDETDEAGRKLKVSLEKDELVFKTKELEGLTRTFEEGQKDVEELLASAAEKKEELREKAGDKGERVPDTKDVLPPWVSGIKERKPAPITDQEEETAEGQKPTQREWTADSGLGFPEKLTQKTLPFTDTGVQAAREIEEEREEEETEARMGERMETKPVPRPGAWFGGGLKGKLVDLAFIAALWLISLFFTAQVIGVSLFRLIIGSPLPLLAFFVILLLLYFFLFLYFLGETLGDRYFSEEE